MLNGIKSELQYNFIALNMFTQADLEGQWCYVNLNIIDIITLD